VSHHAILLEFAFVQLACSPGVSTTHIHNNPPQFSAPGNSLSPRHFAENAALRIDVDHFSSVVYEWRLPCKPEYCRNVDP
jgi:hypothetical protein